MKDLNTNKTFDDFNKAQISMSMEDTEKIGSDFSNCLDYGSIVYIFGDIGVGKSVFTRGAIHSLPGGKNLIVRSPTFLYLFEYPTTPTVVHLDLYRLKEKTNLLDFGLEDWLENRYVLFIEWPQHITDDSIEPNFIVEINMLSENSREIKIMKN